METTVTLPQLAERVKAKDQTGAGLADTLALAVTLVNEHIEGAWREVPQNVFDEAVLRTGFALFDGAKTSDGLRQMAVAEGNPLPRLPRDPLTSAEALLRRYVIGMA